MPGDSNETNGTGETSKKRQLESQQPSDISSDDESATNDDSDSGKIQRVTWGLYDTWFYLSSHVLKPIYVYLYFIFIRPRTHT